MPRKGFKPEQIINRLRTAEIELSQGKTVAQVCKKIGVTEQTYYRWRKEYGGMRTEQVKRLKDLEKENARLKKLVANLSLDNEILKEVASGNF
jgi:transposase-like protein